MRNFFQNLHSTIIILTMENMDFGDQKSSFDISLCIVIAPYNLLWLLIANFSWCLRVNSRILLYFHKSFY